MKNSELLLAIGIRIKEARVEKAITQRNLAQRIGISRATMNYIEKGSTTMNVLILAAICSELDISLDWAVHGI